MSDYQNIVIIGASSGGQALANTLGPILPTSHRILLIDALDFSFWPIASHRAAVVKGWEKKITLPLTQDTVFPANSVNRVIAPNKVVELKENSVVLEKPFEGKTEIPFFKCVIATGSLQPVPMRPAADSTRDEYHQTLIKTQEEIAKAKKIVIIGGGPVGLETAGEIKATHPDTSVTVVHNQPHVLNPSPAAPDTDGKVQSWTAPATPPKLSTQLEKILKDMKIDVILSDKVIIPTEPGTAEEWSGSFGLQEGIKKVKLASGKSIEADYVFISVGNKPNSALVESVDKGAISGGLVDVDEYLRVKSTNTASPLTKNYYAIGDCCSVPGTKTSQGAEADGKHTAANILNEVKGKPLKKYIRPKMEALVIPIGPKRGAGAMTLPVVGTWTLPEAMVRSIKGGDLLVDMAYVPRFKGATKVTADS